MMMEVFKQLKEAYHQKCFDISHKNGKEKENE